MITTEIPSDPSDTEWEPIHSLRAPAPLTGTLSGQTLDATGRAVAARIVLKNSRCTLVKECYPTDLLVGVPTGCWEMRGLAPGVYDIEMRAPGCLAQIRHGVRIEGACRTNLGTVRLSSAPEPPPRVEPLQLLRRLRRSIRGVR
jgi:hypothetical protein